MILGSIVPWGGWEREAPQCYMCCGAFFLGVAFMIFNERQEFLAKRLFSNECCKVLERRYAVIAFRIWEFRYYLFAMSVDFRRERLDRLSTARRTLHR